MESTRLREQIKANEALRRYAEDLTACVNRCCPMFYADEQLEKLKIGQPAAGRARAELEKLDLKHKRLPLKLSEEAHHENT